jgi:hypothetical protein
MPALLAADVSSATSPVATATAAAPPASAGPDNQVFLELLGNGLLYSLNYERFFSAWNQRFGIRGGGSFITYKISSANGAGNLVLASVPVVASWYWGPSPHKLQLGLGASALYVSAATDATGQKFSSSEEGLGIAATAVVGYRYLPRDGGFTFGIGFTPLLRAGRGLLPWGGASGGFAF